MKVKVALTYWCKCGNSKHPHTGIRRIDISHGEGKPREYEVVTIAKFCCIEMEHAYDENFVQFKNVWNHTRSHLATPMFSSFPIGCGLAIVRIRCYPECTSEDNMYINYCPFCGEKIEIEGLK